MVEMHSRAKNEQSKLVTK